MQQAFLEINGVKTNVLTYGKWVEESFKANECKDIILVIPGNPGVNGFYEMFMETLHEKTGFPVWIVGHAGHEIPKKNTIGAIQPLKGNEDLFGLKGQVEHKIDFIKRYVPEDARLHLIGHSIGSYMLIEILKEKSINSRVVDVNLLFPTVEYMAETPNGKFLTRFVKPIVWLVLYLAWIYTILPSFLSTLIMNIYMMITGIPKMHFTTLINFIEPTILEKVFFLAFEDLDIVKKRNDAVFKENLDKIRILYAESDGWAPPKYCNKIKEEHPGINAQMSKFFHTFVLKQSWEIGKLVGDWILAK